MAVGDIVINVIADIGPLVRETARGVASLNGLDRATKRIAGSLKKFESVTGDLGRRLTFVSAAIGGAAAAAFAMTKGVADSGDQIAKSARAAGLSAQYYQEMAFAVGQVTDVTTEELDTALQKLNRTLGEAQSGSKSAVAAFEAIGISAEELKSGSVTAEQAFDALIAKLGETKDPAIAAAIATDLLGRSGAGLGSQLAGGTSEIAGLRDRAKELGLVLSGETLDASEKFGDQWDELTRSFQALKVKLAAVVLPVLVNELIPVIQDKVIPALGQIVEKLGEVIQWFSGLPDPVQQAAGAIAVALGVGGPVLLAISAVSGAIAALVAATGPIGLLIAAAALITTAWVKWGDDFKAAVGGAVDWVIGKFDALIEKLKSIVRWAVDVKDAIAGALTFGGSYEQPTGPTAGFDPLATPTGEGADWRGIGTDAANGLVDGLGAGIDARLPGVAESINKLPQTARDTLGIQSPSRVFYDIGSYISEGMAAGISDSSAMVQAAVDTMGIGASTSAQGTVDDILGSLGQLFSGSKAWSMALAAVNIGRGLSEALALPFPASIAAFARVLAMGKQAMSTIKGASKGSGNIGGGASGAAQAAPAPSPLEVRMSGLNPGDLYSGAAVGKLLDSLSREAGDRGFKLMVAR